MNYERMLDHVVNINKISILYLKKLSYQEKK